MATNKYFYLDKAGLSQYDGLIKTYIDAADALSIKYLTFEPAEGGGANPTTIRFWKVQPAQGATAAYTVTLPDFDTFMTLVSEGTAGNIVELDSNGQVVDSGIAADDLLEKFSSATANTIVIANADGTIGTTNVLLADVIKKSTDEGATFTSGDWVVFDASGNVKSLAKTAANVSFDDTTAQTGASTVQGAIEAVAAAAGGGIATKTVYMANGSSQQYAAVYNIYQGATGSAQNPDPNELIGTINIPKDLVVESGSVVNVVYVDSDHSLHEGSASGTDVTEEIVGPTGTATAADAGQYIKLTIANSSDTHLWIKATNLVDVYTGGTTADIEVDITNNVVTATLTTAVQNKLTLATTALQPVTTATENRIVTFTSTGGIQDSGKTIADITSGIEDVIAPAYDATATYALGDYVIYNGKLYECTTAITTAEAWTAGHWTESKVMTSFQPIPSAYIAGLFPSA